MAVVTAAAGATVATLQAVDVTPSAVIGGSAAQGVVTLTDAAPPGGTVVTLASGHDTLSLPTTVTVAAGQRSVAFAVTTSETDQDRWVDVTASAAGTSRTVRVGVNRPVRPDTVTLSPAEVPAGTSSTATVRLSHPLNADMVLTLSSNNPAASVPASLTMRKGDRTGTFTVATSDGPRSEATITASGGAGSASALLRINGRNGTAACSGFTVTSIAPTTGARGANVNWTITGTGFSATGLTVTVSGTLVTTNTATFVSATTIEGQFGINAGAATGNRTVTVTINGSSCTVPGGFTVT
ncbi:MAG: IPT/TIG domain-containing protein [Vicinamibacterales bacterium]